MKATVSKVSKRIEVKPNKTEGIENYDEDNAYPQRVEDIINASGTGTLCTDIMAKFLYGDGFLDETFGNTVVNSQGLTANKLLNRLAKQIAKYNGCTTHVNYNGLGQKTEINYVPFKNVRFTTEDNKDYPLMLAVYDDWQKIKSRRIDVDKVDFIDFFNDKINVILEQVEDAGGWDNYAGQILYWTTEGNIYPLAQADSVLEDLQTDAQSKIFKFRNISTNFMASYIFETGAFENDEDRTAFAESLKTFQGADETSKIMHVEKEEGADQDSKSINIQKVDIQDIDKLYEYTENSVRDSIIRNYLIPPVLLIQTAGKLGSASEIKDATAFYNGVTKEYRNHLEEIFKKLFTNFVGVTVTDFTIKELTPRVVDVKDTIEGKSKIIEIISSQMTATQKQNILVELFDFSLEDAMKLTNDIQLR